MSSAARKFTPDSPNSNKFDIANPKNTDYSSLANRTGVVEDIRKLETPEYTSMYSDIVKNSSLYKNHKGKFAAMGLTSSAVAGWYGVLLGMGYSPSEAWAKIWETATSWVDATSEFVGDTGSQAITAILKAAWGAFVTFVHSSVGHKLFDDREGTEKALKGLFIFLFAYKIFGFFGINIVTVPIKLLFSAFSGTSGTEKKRVSFDRYD